MQPLQHTKAQNCDVQGWDKRKEKDSEAVEKNIESLKGAAPTLERYMIEFALDEIDARRGLALKSREIATIVMLTAIGDAPSPLKLHLHRALDAGCTRTEVVGAILQAANWVGFAAVLHSTTVAKEVFQERDVGERSLQHNSP